jgi:hypothetical protein
MSYNGGLDYGLLGDFDAIPDIDVVADGLEAALAELLTAARGGEPTRPRASTDGNGTAAAAHRGSNGGPAPIVPAHGRTRRGPASDMRAKREHGSRAVRRHTDQ